MKIDHKIQPMLFPLPAVMVSCGNSPENYNIITLSWVGTICSDPLMCYISVRPGRHSYQLIKDSMEFVINITTKDLAYATDWCGARSGRKFDKFKEMNLTPGQSKMVIAPTIEESPVSIECKVVEIKQLGTHDMFIAKVVNIQVDEAYLDPQSGAFHLPSAMPIAYTQGSYFEQGETIGHSGWSIKEKNRRQR